MLDCEAISEVDLTRALGPGVYALFWNGRRVFVGRAHRNMLSCAMMHMEERFNKNHGFLKPIRFNGIKIWPCRPDQIEDTYLKVLSA